MKLLIKLAVAALIANAVFRIGTEYIVHYTFRDLVREAAMFQAKNEDELRERVVEIADANNVPQNAESFTVQKSGRQYVISGSYTKQIEVAPRFPVDWKFNWDVEAYTTDMPLLPGAPTPKARR
jgi:hypothetical protein